ncbi:hypothetical protein Mgra_00008603 [Meloidogyne graminicola]|uniref:Uncharacterized protein n=1 Tax=Meloidogyne graminicola TaxID=189291 RepID=A0A8S9ZFC3_9BILA|nr:hypothetical protein Mgra_00008603 [Meloidogyne graminicola]
MYKILMKTLNLYFLIIRKYYPQRALCVYICCHLSLLAFSFVLKIKKVMVFLASKNSSRLSFTYGHSFN